MASDIKSTKPILGQSRKRKRFNHLHKLNLNQKIEVQSLDDGFQGSWHIGTVTDRKNGFPVIRYDYLSDKIRANRKQSGLNKSCGKIRPVPPCVKRNRNCLHYGQCVDVFHDNAWWEGVIFDYNDISEGRLVFFPELGDEIMARYENIRFTLDWNAATDKWRIRKDWMFLQVLEELEMEWPILVSVKQIWSEVKTKKLFVDDMMSWTCPVRKKWKETVKEVLNDNFNLTMNEIYGRLNSLVAIERCNSDVDDDSDLGPPGFANLTNLHVGFSVPGPNILPVAKCCPDAIIEYNERFSAGKTLVATSVKLRQHLLYLGWKIECKRKYPGQKRPSLRYRYTDTNGKRFYTLTDICKELNNPSSKTTFLDSEKPNFKKDSSFQESDYICSICHYGGELVLCDQCPSSFHTFCLGLKEVPDGEWFCPSCCCRICTKNQYDEHCEQSTDSSILSCEQCERIYHIGCLNKTGRSSTLDTNTKIKWFCSPRCEEIFTGLERLLEKSIPVGTDNLTWTLRKYKKTEFLNRSKLNVVIKLLHECFNPVKEPLTQRDIIEDVIFCKGSELNRLNFKGFYTILLEKGNVLISAGTLRVYGVKVAELPFVGTRVEYRKRGMCRILMNELEKNLVELGVERLVLPAASSVVQTWTKSFGFSVMTEQEKLNFLGYTFLDFQGTRLCHKLLTNSLRSIKPTISIGNICNAINEVDIEKLEGVNAVSEVSQSEQVEGIVRDSHCSPGSSQCNGAADNVSGTTSLDILMNGPIIVECQKEVNVECSTEDHEDHNDDNVLIKCFQRRKIEACGR